MKNQRMIINQIIAKGNGIYEIEFSPIKFTKKRENCTQKLLPVIQVPINALIIKHL